MLALAISRGGYEPILPVPQLSYLPSAGNSEEPTVPYMLVGGDDIRPAPTEEPTPTPEPEATPTPQRAARQAHTGTPPTAIICASAYAWSCGWAIDTTWCESRWDPGADTNPPYVGLWQVENGAYDPETNTRQAYRKWGEWQAGHVANPWPHCG